MKNNTRKPFVKILKKLMSEDSKVMLLVGDLGFSYFDDFPTLFPDRYINVGIMEQSMMGIAAGLALSGKKPYVYSIANFVTLRPCEQVRNDIAYHNANVKIIGAGGRNFYPGLGFTHNVPMDEDIRVMELCGIDSYVIKDPEFVEKVVMETYKTNKPVYIRLDKHEG